MISYNLAGKTALVTGGASGIGFATARMLARFGATVAVNHLADDPRGPEAVDKLIDEGGKAISAPGSVGERGAAERMVTKAVSDLGRLDLLVNNAGTPGTRRRITPPELELITEDLWSQLLETNLLGVFRCAKAAAPALKAANGAIVNTASIAGLGRAGSSLAYSATKAGVVSLTQNLARALAPEVRVNAIAPGAVDSSWMVEWTNDERQQSIERALLKRRCQPEDLAEVILFLGIWCGDGDGSDHHGGWWPDIVRFEVVPLPLPSREGVGEGANGNVAQNVITTSAPKVKELSVPFELAGGLLLNGLLSVNA